MPKTSLRFEQQDFRKYIDTFLSEKGIIPRLPNLFYLSCIHRSVLNEGSEFFSESNERLEFLGDAVLELSITEFLFHDFPHKPEGELTDMRSALVRGRNLASIAGKLGFSDIIQLSRGEYRVGGHENPYILANTFEAFIGAYYENFGFDAVKDWIKAHVYSTLQDIIEKGLYVDPKSYLQEITQEIWGVLPVYAIESESGEDHNKTYNIVVTIGDVILGKGKGTSKKKGEQDAAENAISLRKNWEHSVNLPKKLFIE